MSRFRKIHMDYMKKEDEVNILIKVNPAMGHGGLGEKAVDLANKTREVHQAGGISDVISTRELVEFLRVVFARLPVRALDIVEVAPPLDCADVTTFAATKVIYEVFGWVKEKLDLSNHSDSIDNTDN